MTVTPFEIHGQKLRVFMAESIDLIPGVHWVKLEKTIASSLTQVEAPQVEFDPSRSRTSG